MIKNIKKKTTINPILIEDAQGSANICDRKSMLMSVKYTPTTVN